MLRVKINCSPAQTPNSIESTSGALPKWRHNFKTSRHGHIWKVIFQISGPSPVKFMGRCVLQGLKDPETCWYGHSKDTPSPVAVELLAQEKKKRAQVMLHFTSPT